MSSLVLNMVGGGGGGLSSTDAILRVMAPAGSTVTISKGGVTKSDNGHENALAPTVYDYYFVIKSSQFDSVNSWTVTATLNEQTATKTIVIDAALEYGLTMTYPIILFDNGDQKTDVTGGYTRANLYNTNSVQGTLSIGNAEGDPISYSISAQTQQALAVTGNQFTFYADDVLRVTGSAFSGPLRIFVTNTKAANWGTSSPTTQGIAAPDLVNEFAFASQIKGYLFIGTRGSSSYTSASGSITKIELIRSE